MRFDRQLLLALNLDKEQHVTDGRHLVFDVVAIFK